MFGSFSSFWPSSSVFTRPARPPRTSPFTRSGPAPRRSAARSRPARTTSTRSGTIRPGWPSSRRFRFKTNLAFGPRAIDGAWPEGGRSYRSEPKEFLGSLALAWQPVRRVTFSAGLFYPYTYESSWSPNFGPNSDCRQNRLRTTYIRAAAAVEVFKGFAVSAGVDYVTSALQWKHLITVDPTTIVDSRHELTGRGWGFAAGVLWKIVPALQVGARFHQAVPIDYAGSCIQVNYYVGAAAALSDSLAAPPSVSAPPPNSSSRTSSAI